MKNYFRLELIDFFNDRKNQVILLILFVASLVYAIYLLPNEQLIEEINLDAMEVSYDSRKEFLDHVQLTEGTHFSVQYAAAVYPEWNDLEKKRIDFLKDKDYSKYAQAAADWYEYSDSIYRQKVDDSLRYPDRYYADQNPYGYYDGHFAYQRAVALNAGLAKYDKPLTLNILNEKTSLQVLYRLSQAILPVLLLSVAIFFMGNSLTKDQYHVSVVEGYPISKGRRLLCKSFVVITGMIVVLLLLVPSFLLVGIKNGFGSLSLPLPIYVNDLLNNGEFHTITIGSYFAYWGLFLLLWLVSLLLSNFLLSFIFKNEILNVMVLLVVILMEVSYYRRGVGNYGPFDWLPSSYVRFGEVISGLRSFLYGSISYTQSSGMILLAIISLLLLVAVMGFARRKGRML